MRVYDYSELKNVKDTAVAIMFTLPNTHDAVTRYIEWFNTTYPAPPAGEEGPIEDGEYLVTRVKEGGT